VDEKRLAMLEAMIAKGSTDPFVHYARAMELRSAGRLDKALDRLAEVESRFPEYVPTYLMAAQTAEELGRIDEARGFADRGIERARSAGDAHALSELEGMRSALE
jgi:tetratricopeptide (TPR) repeat protein